MTELTKVHKVFYLISAIFIVWMYVFYLFDLVLWREESAFKVISMVVGALAIVGILYTTSTLCYPKGKEGEVMDDTSQYSA
jgi:amino acid permease